MGDTQDASRHRAELTIPVTDLDAGGKAYRFVLRPAWIRAQLEDHEATASDKEGVLEVRASKSGHDVVVNGTLDTELSIPCARCLEPFRLPLHSDIRVLFVPSSKARAQAKDSSGEEGLELTEEEADTFGYDGENVVLDDLVRGELILEIPMIPLCSEGCPGISPAPSPSSAEEGTGEGDKPIDPRLLPLLAFQSKKTKS